MNLFLITLIALSYGNTFSKKTITVKDKNITVEVADTDSLRQQGLMYRKSLAKDEGMLFIFSDEQPLSFWMKNTFIHLTIAYFNKNKILIDLKDMPPFGKKQGDPPTYRSARPAMYALEMNVGWFKTNKIGLGSKLSLP